MEWIRSRKGGFVIHLGFGSFIIAGIIVFLLISHQNPDTATGIVERISDLSQAFQGLKP